MGGNLKPRRPPAYDMRLQDIEDADDTPVGCGAIFFAIADANLEIRRFFINRLIRPPSALKSHNGVEKPRRRTLKDGPKPRYIFVLRGKKNQF